MTSPAFLQGLGLTRPGAGQKPGEANELEDDGGWWGELSPMGEGEREEEGEEEPRGGQRLSNCYLLPHLLPITIQERPRTQTRT